MLGTRVSVARAMVPCRSAAPVVTGILTFYSLIVRGSAASSLSTVSVDIICTM